VQVLTAAAPRPSKAMAATDVGRRALLRRGESVGLRVLDDELRQVLPVDFLRDGVVAAW